MCPLPELPELSFTFSACTSWKLVRNPQARLGQEKVLRLPLLEIAYQAGWNYSLESMSKKRTRHFFFKVILKTSKGRRRQYWAKAGTEKKNQNSTQYSMLLFVTARSRWISLDPELIF